jgi:protease I
VIYPELEEEPVKAVDQRFSANSHLVWGRVVPDIPDFCRELIAALAEE